MPPTATKEAWCWRGALQPLPAPPSDSGVVGVGSTGTGPLMRGDLRVLNAGESLEVVPAGCMVVEAPGMRDNLWKLFVENPKRGLLSDNWLRVTAAFHFQNAAA